MQAYMKSQTPYYGIRLPDVRRICGPIFDAHPVGSEASFEDAVERMFVEARNREERYAANQRAPPTLPAFPDPGPDPAVPAGDHRR